MKWPHPYCCIFGYPQTSLIDQIHPDVGPSPPDPHPLGAAFLTTHFLHFWWSLPAQNISSICECRFSLSFEYHIFFFLLLVQSKCKVYQSIMCCRTFIIFNLRRKYYRWKVSYFFIVLSITGKAYHMTMWNWNYTELSWKIQPSGIIWHNMCHITTTLTKRCTVLPWNSFKLWFYY